MLKIANRFIGYSFEFVKLRKLLDFSKGCLAGPSAFENYFSGYPPEKPIFVGHRNAHAQNPLQLQSRHSDNLKRNMAQILLKIVCADDLKHLFREILLKFRQSKNNFTIYKKKKASVQCL